MKTSTPQPRHKNIIINLFEDFSPFYSRHPDLPESLQIKNIGDVDLDGYADFIIKNTNDVNYLVFGNKTNNLATLDFRDFPNLKELQPDKKREHGYTLPKGKYLSIASDNFKWEDGQPEMCYEEPEDYCGCSEDYIVETRKTVDIHYDINYNIRHSHTIDHGVRECIGKECTDSGHPNGHH